MFRKIGIAVAVVLALFLVFVATRSSTFHIERSTVINAPPETVFAQVSDFHAWEAWSPWAKLDPSMKKSYEGAPSGVGSVYAWSGNKQVGEGRMTMQKVEKPSLVAVKLEFLKPFEATNTATFSFAKAAGGTKTTWAMDGDNNFIGKAMSIFMDMDKMVGGDFERGLAGIKAAAESAAAANEGPAR